VTALNHYVTLQQHFNFSTSKYITLVKLHRPYFTSIFIWIHVYHSPVINTYFKYKPTKKRVLFYFYLGVLNHYYHRK